MEHDKGFVQGDSTWHRLPQYQTIPDRSITVEEALQVAGYPLEKRPLYWFNEQAEGVDKHLQVGAYCIIRKDKMVPVVDSVGERFVVVDNSFMVERIRDGLLNVYPDLRIESVGTLFNGGTFFINLRVGEFRVVGDKSETISNLMYCNPLGRGKYVACAHNTRIVCNNTEQVAEAEGVLNQSLRRFRHTAYAKDAIEQHLLEIGELKLALTSRFESLNHLAGEKVTDANIDAFLEELFPLPKEDGRTKTIAENNRLEILGIIHGREHREYMVEPMTKYGLYMAYTDWVDHHRTSRNSDEASITIDGLIGSRAGLKEGVFKSLMKKVWPV
jgi:phage/plasmid-like protein (TIGR03299 family)